MRKLSPVPVLMLLSFARQQEPAAFECRPEKDGAGAPVSFTTTCRS
jgi:hypothetical protein